MKIRTALVVVKDKINEVFDFQDEDLLNSMEQEMECLLKLNPQIEFVIYTLDFKVAAGMIDLCKKFSIKRMDLPRMW